MNTDVPILEGAEPYSSAGGPRGALVLHGFTGSPQSMRPLAQAFAAAGYTVELPLLPGHGTSVEDMASYGWPDWIAAADAAYAGLASRCSSVVVAGLSMGGSLTLWLAAAHPEIAGIVLVNPVVESDDFAPLMEAATQMLEAGTPVMPGVGNDVADPDVTELAYQSMPNTSVLSLGAGLAAVKQRLPQIEVPALVLRSTQDHIVPPGSVRLLTQRLAGKVELVELASSFHVATIDFDSAEISERAVQFADQVSSTR